MPLSLSEAFHHYFRIVVPSTPELMAQVYALRYNVYCLETGFENPELYPDKMESDENEQHSVHCLIQHKETGLYAATTRIILADPKQPERPFPIELHCRIDQTEEIKKVSRERIGEVSRFCVSKDFKRRFGERGTLAGIPATPAQTDWKGEERRSFALITFALVTCMIRASVELRLTHWYAVMEPSLIRFLKKHGINFTVIGPEAEYHGRRVPCVIKIQNLIDGVYEKNTGLFDLITDNGKYSKFSD